MSPETATILVAGIGGWATIVGGLLDLRKRTNGPLTAKFEEVKAEVREVKADVQGVKADVHEVKADVRELRQEFRDHLAGDGR